MTHPKDSASDNTSNTAAIQDLLAVMTRLRDPKTGCAWDIKQTWQSIIPHTLEEVYEVADAVDRNDAADLCDELGDLLLQVVFMAQIASDNGLFDFNDVARGISAKMIRRHPHIFADTVYASEAAQKQGWEAIKQQERAAKMQSVKSALPTPEPFGAGQGIGSAHNDFLEGIPLAMPALRRAQKIQKRAAHVGFDWEDWRLVVPKVYEELDEVIAAVDQGESFQRVEEEVGDVLMAASNLARQLKVDAENALRLANNKFSGRFMALARDLAAQGISLAAAEAKDMEAAWERVKQLEQLKKKPLA